MTLTAKGEKIAKEIEKRHIMLKDFLIRFIGVEEQKADDTACRMEHAMDTSTFKKFQAFIQSMDE